LAKEKDSKGLTIHASQKLRNDSPFHLPLGTFSFWGNGINLIDEK
jgi:hypothetical protein